MKFTGIISPVSGAGHGLLSVEPVAVGLQRTCEATPAGHTPSR